ncbi:hypothetical protein PUNSTDRAFT_51677 [Punctularia strigosozonata HHB-11173 SS5]|uniref:uncharacterized protein n=1 Tax=Punctularia strigosozonata (strain HHB-11173) TaxID=741275 RepID=UPI0004417BF9|nr:uncharacterized protein PUNSTDRAFT_51677 [Punctularia strigosozonata HHB-11173 SS5]EIN09404.1 hypothetical protein PUNSTDRAFT_51677 [Punctularia strigosozonata HHB-11173 SS5]
MHERHPDFIDQLPWGFAPTSNNDEPLVRCKYTYWEATNEWSFSMSWCHLLGDGLSLWRFCDNLHRHYLGLPPRFIPTFEKYTTKPPTLERSALLDTIPLVPHLAVDYAPEHFFAMYTQMLETTSRIDLQFSKDQLQKMRLMAEKHAGVKISTQDALTAYLITVLNRTEQVPASWLMNVVDYRGVSAAPGCDYTPPPITSAGNITLTRFSDKIPDEAKLDVGRIATVVRDTISKTRDPDYCRRAVAISEELYTRSSNANRCQWWFPWEGGVAANNLYCVPWTGCHFGYPGKARFHVYDSWERYFRIWPGNPTKNAQGDWDANEGSARVFFRIKHHHKDKFLEIVKDDLHRMEVVDILKAKM